MNSTSNNNTSKVVVDDNSLSPSTFSHVPYNDPNFGQKQSNKNYRDKQEVIGNDLTEVIEKDNKFGVANGNNVKLIISSGTGSRLLTTGIHSPILITSPFNEGKTKGTSSRGFADSDKVHLRSEYIDSHLFTAGNHCKLVASGPMSHVIGTGKREVLHTFGINSIACSLGLNSTFMCGSDGILIGAWKDKNGKIRIETGYAGEYHAKSKITIQGFTEYGLDREGCFVLADELRKQYFSNQNNDDDFDYEDIEDDEFDDVQPLTSDNPLLTKAKAIERGSRGIGYHSRSYRGN